MEELFPITPLLDNEIGQPAQRLAAIRTHLHETTGNYLDPEIEEAVVAMNAMRFYTYQSCGGHVEREGLDVSDMLWEAVKFHEHKIVGGPWIDFAAFPLDGDTDPFEAEEQRHTELDIQRICEAMELRLLSYLDEFYSGRQVAADVRLIFGGDGSYYLRSQGSELLRNIHLLSRTERLARLGAYRTEMNDFAAFLKAKYLAGTDQ